jgi:hypothetical protein
MSATLPGGHGSGTAEEGRDCPLGRLLRRETGPVVKPVLSGTLAVMERTRCFGTPAFVLGKIERPLHCAAGKDGD